MSGRPSSTPEGYANLDSRTSSASGERVGGIRKANTSEKRSAALWFCKPNFLERRHRSRRHRGGNGPGIELFQYTAPDQDRTFRKNSDFGGHHIAFYVRHIDKAVK